jgi:hypothetical protein
MLSAKLDSTKIIGLQQNTELRQTEVKARTGI